MKPLLSSILLGAAVSLSAAPTQRIVTLGGPATEIVFSLGAGDQVVAVDASSRYPESALEGLPVLGYVAAVSAEGLLSVNPEVIVSTDRLGPPAVVEQLESTQLPMLIVESPNSVASLEQAITDIGAKLGKEKQAAELWSTILSDLRKAETMSAGQSPRVVFLLASNGSAMAAGSDTQGGGIVALAGGVNIFSDHTGYKPVSEEALLASQPDIILVGSRSSEPTGDTAAYMKQMGLERLAESTDAAIHVIGLSEFLTFGPRTGQAAVKLAQIFSETENEG